MVSAVVRGAGPVSWVLMLMALAGCRGAVVGDWQLTRAVPSREVFAIDDATFGRDGRFTATITRDGRTHRQSGEFEFNGYKLTLRPSAGGQYRFNAVRKPGSLEISDGKRRIFLRPGKVAEPPSDDDAPATETVASEAGHERE